MIESSVKYKAFSGSPEMKESAFWSLMTSYQIYVVFSPAMGSMIEGYSLAWSSPSTESLLHSESSRLRLNNAEVAWISSAMPLVAAFVSCMGGYLMEKIGRKYTLILASVPTFFAAIIVTFAQSVTHLYVGRALTGVGLGLSSQAIPVYQGETIHANVRGILGLVPTSLGNFSLLLCYCLGLTYKWNELATVQIFMAALFFFMMMFAPETPRYLISKGEKERARRVLRRLRGTKDIDEEFNEMVKNAEKAKIEPPFKFGEVLKSHNIRPIAVSCLLMFFQQLSGVNAVMFYSVTIFEMSNISYDSNWCAITIAVVNIIATLFSHVGVDWLGRKVLLKISAIGMIFCLFGLALYFQIKEWQGWHVYEFIPVTCLLTYLAFFSIGFGPIPWLMNGELFPSKVRSFGSSVSTCAHWVFTFLVTNYFYCFIDSIGMYGVFYFFGSIMCASIPFIHFCVPETKGRSLEELENNEKGDYCRLENEKLLIVSDVENDFETI